MRAPTRVRKFGALCAKCEKPQWMGKLREKIVGAKLLEWAAASLIIPFTSADKALAGSGLPYRIDFGYNLPDHYIGVEVSTLNMTLPFDHV